jgi:hypothetical protein
MPRSIAVLAWMSFAAFGMAQDGELCGTCKTTGMLENPLATSKDRAESDVVYCSVALDRDKAALGCDFLVCPNCKAESEQALARDDFEREVGRRRKWLDGRRAEVDAIVKRDVVHVKTAHFEVAFDIPQVKVGTVVHRAHAAAHLYAERVEKLYADILSLHDLTDGRLRRSQRFLYFSDSIKALDALAVHLKVGGGRSNTFGDPCRVFLHLDKKTFREDEQFHQYVAHHVSHHVHNDVMPANYWLNERYGWVAEGLAHFVEIRWFGVPNTWCTSESGGDYKWQSKSWEANVKKALLSGDAPLFEEVIKKQSSALNARDHQFAWSYIDYLMWLDPKAMPKMLGLMKGPQLPTRDCLKQAYGIAIPEFVAGWQEFVTSEYSTIPRKGPQPRAPRGAQPPPPGDEDDDQDPEDAEDEDDPNR